MNIYQKKLPILILLALITILHTVSVFWGWYDAGYPVDTIQHMIAGIVFVLVWKQGLLHYKIILPPVLIVITSITFATSIGFVWEVLEAIFKYIFPSLAEASQLQSSTVEDVITDIGSSVLLATIYSLSIMQKKERSS